MGQTFKRFLIGMGIVIGAYLAAHLAGRYVLVSVGFGATETRHPIAYRLDRWTGRAWLIRGLDAYEVKNSPLVSPSDPGNKW